MHIRFVLMKHQINPHTGKAGLYCRITIDGIRAPEFSTGVFVEPAKWDSKSQKLIGLDEWTANQNRKLLQYINELDDVFMQLKKAKEPFTARTVRAIYLGESRYTLLQVFEKFNIEKKKMVKEGSFKNYPVCLNALRRFLQSRSLEKLAISDFSNRLGEQYKRWLLTEGKLDGKPYDKNYASKNIVMLKEVMDFAEREEMITKSAIDKVHIKRSHQTNLVYLEKEELKELEDYVFRQPRLQQVADMFVFCCYTGLAYAELANLTMDNIRFNQKDGRDWLYINRQKSERYKSKSALPLLKKPKAILEKYEGKLPVISNPKINSYLKEIAEILDFREDLTWHAGRKTFADMALNEWNVSLETVSAMLGHKNIRTTQQFYVDIRTAKIARDMRDIQ